MDLEALIAQRTDWEIDERDDRRESACAVREFAERRQTPSERLFPWEDSDADQ